MDKKIIYPFGQRKCQVCKRLVSIGNIWGEFKLNSHGPGVDTLFCAGSGTPAKPTRYPKLRPIRRNRIVDRNTT